MKNKILAMSGVMFSILGVAQAYASEFSTSTAITSATTLVSDVSTIIGGTVGVILSLLAALLGLGWAVRKFRSKIAGKKF